jgi:type II secretory pathway pseudopilin PulG
MTDQRGLSLVELLVAAVLTTIVAGALFSAYIATARSFGESSAQAALQRQGSLALEEIGRQVRGAVEPNVEVCDGNAACIESKLAGRPRHALTLDTCNGIPDSLWVRTAAETKAGDICYYARDDGALCEVRAGTCRNLLAGGLKTVVLLRQPAGPDPRCPPFVPAGAPWCFRMAPIPSVGPMTQVDLAFAIRDSDGDLDGENVMAFSLSVTCSGRNC